jgi:hypothetical protein
MKIFSPASVGLFCFRKGNLIHQYQTKTGTRPLLDTIFNDKALALLLKTTRRDG